MERAQLAIPEAKARLNRTAEGDQDQQQQGSLARDEDKSHGQVYGSAKAMSSHQRLPNYKPTPLRVPYLAVLISAIVLLMIFLELACHSYPAEQDIASLPTAGPGMKVTRASEDDDPSKVVIRCDTGPIYIDIKKLKGRDIQFVQNADCATPGKSKHPGLGSHTVTNVVGEQPGNAQPVQDQPTPAPPPPPPPVTLPDAGSSKDGAQGNKPAPVDEEPPATTADNEPEQTPPASPSNRPALTPGNSPPAPPPDTIPPPPPPPPVQLPVPTIITLTDSSGSPTATQTTVTSTPVSLPSPVTLTDSRGVATATRLSIPGVSSLLTPTLITLTDAKGRPTATQTSLIIFGQTILTDSRGVPTATVQGPPIMMSIAPAVRIRPGNGVGVAEDEATTKVVTEHLTDSSGRVTGTATHTVMISPSRSAWASPPGTEEVQVYDVSTVAYFIGFFLPTVLSVVLAIATRILNQNAMLYQPFHLLSSYPGLSAADTLCLRFDYLPGLLASLRSLGNELPLPLLTALLAACATILVPLSSEAVGLKLYGSCKIDDFEGCAMALAVFLVPSRIILSILACMVLLLLAICLVLRRWRSGVAWDPWSLGGIAALDSQSAMKAFVRSLPVSGDRVTQSQLTDCFRGCSFRLAFSQSPDGASSYGFMASRGRGASGNGVLQGPTSFLQPLSRTFSLPRQGKLSRFISIFPYTRSIAFMLLGSGLLVLTAYYMTTETDTAFEHFMNSQSLAVRFIFTSLGVLIAFFWSSFLETVAISSPFRALATSPQRSRTLFLCPPTNPFSGLVAATRRRDPFLGLIAFTAVMSEFMPILLNNVPFRLTQTWETHTSCAWAAAGMLAWMLLVVLGSWLFVKWPKMPVTANTVAGLWYYVADSEARGLFEGMSTLEEREVHSNLRRMECEFMFGEMTGMSGIKRVGIKVMATSDDESSLHGECKGKEEVLQQRAKT